MTNYTKKLITVFERHANADNAFYMKKYMRDQFDYFGIKTPERRLLVKDFLKVNGLPPEKEIEKIVWELWNHKKRECHYAAIEILEKTKNLWKQGHIKLFEKMALKNSWWDSVDTIANILIGPYFEMYFGQTEKITSKWNNSTNIWLQRLSIIFQLMYKKETNEKLLYNYINNLRSSEEFFVQKAIGWALRQYARTNPESVKKFTGSTKLKPLSFREATKYL